MAENKQNFQSIDYNHLKLVEDKFKKIKYKATLWAIVVGAGFLGEALVKLYARSSGPHLLSIKELEDTARFLKAIGVFSMLYLWWKVWICPVCLARLGVTKLPFRKISILRFCPYCKVPLEFSDDPEATKAAMKQLQLPEVREVLTISKLTSNLEDALNKTKESIVKK